MIQFPDCRCAVFIFHLFIYMYTYIYKYNFIEIVGILSSSHRESNKELWLFVHIDIQCICTCCIFIHAEFLQGVCIYIGIHTHIYIYLYMSVLARKFQVLMQAISLADKSGTNDISTLLPKDGPSSSDLASLDNILGRYLSPEIPPTAPLRQTSISAVKSAVTTFQTWAMRTPGLVGVLFGQQGKSKAWKGLRILVAPSFQAILEDHRTAEMCEQDQVRPVGVIQVGSAAANEASREIVRTQCQAFIDEKLKVSLCIYATCNRLCTYIYMFSFCFKSIVFWKGWQGICRETFGRVFPWQGDILSCCLKSVQP